MIYHLQLFTSICKFHQFWRTNKIFRQYWCSYGFHFYSFDQAANYYLSSSFVSVRRLESLVGLTPLHSSSLTYKQNYFIGPTRRILPKDIQYWITLQNTLESPYYAEKVSYIGHVLTDIKNQTLLAGHHLSVMRVEWTMNASLLLWPKQ